MPHSNPQMGTDAPALLGWVIAVVCAAVVLVYVTLNLPALGPFWAALKAVFS